MQLTPRRLKALILSLFAVAFLGALDHTIVSTSLATIAGELGALGQMAWIVVAYTLASTVLLPVLGKLGDVLGARRVFLVCLAVFVLASLACGLAQDLVQLVAARAVQGMSSAGLQLMSHTIVALVTSPRERPAALSLVGAAFPVAIVVGPVVGGVLTDTLGWPWVFWVNVPVGVAAFAVALVAIPALPAGGHRRFDIGGALALTIAMVALVLGVTWSSEPAMAAVAPAVSAVAAAAFAAFVAIERRAVAPLVPVRLLRDRTVVACLALSAVIGVGLFSVVSYIPTFVQMAYGTSATVSGLVPIATVFGMLVSNLLVGWLASRTGRYRLFPVVGTALAAGGLAAMALLPADLPLPVPMAAMAVVGIGTGAFMNLIVAVVQSAAPRDEIGAVTATTNLVRQIGATVGTAVIGAIVAAGVATRAPAGVDARTLTPHAVRDALASVQTEVAAAYADVFAPVFGALAAVYVLGLVAAALLPAGVLPDRPPSPTGSPQPAAAPIPRRHR